MTSKVRLKRFYELKGYHARVVTHTENLSLLRLCVVDSDDLIDCRRGEDILARHLGEELPTWLKLRVCADFLRGPERSPRIQSALIAETDPDWIRASLIRDSKVFPESIGTTLSAIEQHNRHETPPKELWQLGAAAVRLNPDRWAAVGHTIFPAPGVASPYSSDDLNRLTMDTLLCAHLLGTGVSVQSVDRAWASSKLQAGHGVLPLVSRLPILAAYLKDVGYTGEDPAEAMRQVLSRIVPRADWNTHVRRVRAVVDCHGLFLDSLPMWRNEHTPKPRKPSHVRKRNTVRKTSKK